MVEFSKVEVHQLPELQHLAKTYVKELMNTSSETQSPIQLEAYINERFSLDDPEKSIVWAIVDDRPIGFTMFRVDNRNKLAFIHDFFVVPEKRRRNYGTEMLKWIIRHLQEHGIEHIDLHVAINNSAALQFWEAQRFNLIQYRLRRSLCQLSG